ncbi:ankyrin repeat domain-containing protein 49-like [Pectinophora gossypiella]|uniref:ankyrin repeat domain-containing protein 49-like n=1 Tax=Pectinophora gossypiella TaxID=13191 RepID=UPI00214E88D2|nr:ankyrin repeat domain-containing protein 49-like [Pectinophora gossypiella]XP_049881049.1 ankyrin repeat domain-containing protein 49-like [Pectinophora gossypiella]
MSDSEDSDNFDPNELQDIHDEIEKCKKNPSTAGMFVSGWDDADQDVDVVKDPKANPIDHVLWAAENGEVEALKEILSSQPGLVHARDSDGYTPLHRAAYGNHVTAISYLLSMNASVSAKTELGWTPLHSACNWNNYLAAARLLAAGADPTAVSDGDQTPLHLTSAISHCKSTLLILLLREDIVDIVKKPNNSGETPEDLARGHGIYAPLFEMAIPAASYIRSLAFTCNPYVQAQLKLTN